MGKQGKLTREKFGFDMPVDQPLYPRPPVYYRDMESITVGYETDEEAALAILPEAEGFELTLPATVRVVIARMPFTTYGAYEEAYQLLD
jgi:acetoacetate decarboxylase